ncbi:MAG: hypothetical protein DK304_000139 [Chloroflexi bacterium]|jgi:hypothetical protein|nr:MAG: hypothetical protein DK304_000139 [Chloroflexota bacterium]
MAISGGLTWVDTFQKRGYRSWKPKVDSVKVRNDSGIFGVSISDVGLAITVGNGVGDTVTTGVFVGSGARVAVGSGTTVLVGSIVGESWSLKSASEVVVHEINATIDTTRKVNLTPLIKIPTQEQ